MGGRRALHDYAKEGQETYPVTGKLSLLSDWLTEKLALGDVVVMVSGDPGFYSLLPWLKTSGEGDSRYFIGAGRILSDFRTLAGSQMAFLPRKGAGNEGYGL